MVTLSVYKWSITIPSAKCINNENLYMKYMQVMTNTEVPNDSQWFLGCTVHEGIFLLFKRNSKHSVQGFL